MFLFKRHMCCDSLAIFCPGSYQFCQYFTYLTQDGQTELFCSVRSANLVECIIICCSTFIMPSSQFSQCTDIHSSYLVGYVISYDSYDAATSSSMPFQSSLVLIFMLLFGRVLYAASSSLLSHVISILVVI